MRDRIGPIDNGLLTGIASLLMIAPAALWPALGAALPDGWRLLVDNKPMEAREAFAVQAQSGDGAAVGNAGRGLAAVADFLGQNWDAMDHTFKSFLADNDTILFDAQWINVIAFGRTASGRSCKNGYRALKHLTSRTSLYGGEHFSAYIDRLVNDGKLGKAQELTKRLGIVRSFMMIGPFENISGSGYRKAYPPELERDFTKEYGGKDGARAGWFAFYNENPSGWLFTENNYAQYHATLYYYSTVVSDAARDVYLGFGASGAFKVFLNGNVVLADSVFRNTGTDMFMQKVRLLEGDNALLIKLCHETISSNFLVRFMGDDGGAVAGLRFCSAPGVFRADTAHVANLLSSPTMDRMRAYLLDRLAADSDNLEAALLLMRLYNAAEFTDEGQKLARRFLEKYPSSSLWHSLFSESLLRSRKLTDAQTELKTAYRLCALNKMAWDGELEVLSGTAGTREVKDFLDSSPEIFRNTTEALMMRVSHFLQNGNESDMLATLEELEKRYSSDGTVVELLAAFYSNRGDTKKARSLLRNLIKYEHSSIDAHEQLGELYLKMGQRSKAFRAYEDGLRYSPVSPGTHHYMARLLFQLKDLDGASRHVEAGLAIMPTSSTLLNLKGSILAARGKQEQAAAVLRQSIAYDYNNFSAWDQLLPLEGKPTLGSLTAVPDPDSLLEQTKGWKDIDGDNGSILAYVNDLFFYPSRCSRERYFLMVRLPTQSAIDTWKEYTIQYNSYYQLLNITRGFSKSGDGKETPADISRNMVVFKTLQPGDYIVLEWNLENYYTGDMAKHIWGEFSFDMPYPVYTSVLRLIAPPNDTIPFRLQGDSVEVSSQTVDGFRITTLSRPPYRNPAPETFMLIEAPSSNRVFYSTVPGWSDVANWYLNLTENKLEQTSELKAVADSILEGARDLGEKVARIHDFVAGAIRYSFVPFRQSAWIPQPAREVLATKIGDCKDMSSLAKSLFDYAGIESRLVLVNTRDDNGLYPGYIGPNFNHCIVSYRLDGARRYLDMTDNNLSAHSLPKMDQGALALVVEKDNDSLIHLPLDESAKRVTKRAIRCEVLSDGTFGCDVKSVRTGIFAGHMRALYRFLSDGERKRALQKVLIAGFPNATVDTLRFENIDSLTDTLCYEYGYSVKNAAHFSGNTAIIPLNLPDCVTGESYPSEEDRHYDIDMGLSWFDVGSFVIEGEIAVPKGWRPITLPPAVRLSNEYGTYELSFRREKSRVLYRRTADFRFAAPIRAADSAQLREFLSSIAKADNVQLMFYTR